MILENRLKKTSDSGTLGAMEISYSAFTFQKTEDGSFTLRVSSGDGSAATSEAASENGSGNGPEKRSESKLETGSATNPQPAPELALDPTPTPPLAPPPPDTPVSRTHLSEAMHSLKGAFSETVYIYGTAISHALANRYQPRVLSLGLGLGYVEILAVALILKQARLVEDSHGAAARAEFLQRSGGESFELLAPLRRWFEQWALKTDRNIPEEFARSTQNLPLDLSTDQSRAHLSAHSHNQSNNHASDFSYDLPADFAHAYDGILERTANETGVAPTLIHETLALMIQDGRWKIRAALDATTEFSEQFGCICFDAFSSRTSPELWSEDFLKAFFAKVAAPQCVLSTYACTGTLKRSLKASGFVITIREGFSSKRDSTFAVRSGQTSLN